jgi:iron complex outermembrane recepter protein
MKNSRSKPISATVAAAIAGASLHGGTVLAQDSSAIEEIVVTAQRVEQNLQDVPLSVSAISAEQLKEANVTDATRLEQIAPGLVIGKSGTDLRPAIRGVRTENVGANADPTIGFFVDGVYQSRPSQALAAFVDLERVEVLRGPQGTLFGRNTYGGAISLISARPKEGFSAGVDAMLGRFSRKRFEGFVNGSASDTVQLRVAGMWEEADGYIENIGVGNDLGDEDQYYLRPSVRFVPNENLEILVSGQYWKQKGAGLGAFGYKSRGTLVDSSLLSATNSGRSLTGSAVRVNSRIRDGVADVGAFDVGVPVLGDGWTVNFDTTAARDNEMRTGMIEINYDFGSLALKSITSYVDWFSFRTVDNDFSEFALAQDYNVTDAETLSQELQLIGPQDGALRWIVGAYYFDDAVRETFYNDQNAAFPAAGSAAAMGPPFQANTPTGAPFPLVRADFLTPVLVDTESVAVFAQGTYAFSDAFAVTAGVRYTEDKKAYSRLLGSVAGLTLDQTAGLAFTQRDQRATFEKTTWRVSAEYKPTEDNLLYASASTGFTSGGFNGGTFTVGTVVTPLPPFEPQLIRAYEVGSKNRFLDGRLQLNGAVFFNDLTDLQVQTQVPVPGALTVLSITGNAGAAESNGVELEAVWQAGDALTLTAAATYLDAEYTRLFLSNPFPNPAITCPSTTVIALPVGRLLCVVQSNGASVAQVDLEGAKIPYSPEFTLRLAADYDIVTSVGTFTPSINFFASDGHFNVDFNTAIDRQDSWTKTDLRLNWVSSDEKYSAQLFVENVEDEEVNQRGVFGGNNSLNSSYAPPRLWGLRGSVRF